MNETMNEQLTPELVYERYILSPEITERSIMFYLTQKDENTIEITSAKFHNKSREHCIPILEKVLDHNFIQVVGEQVVMSYVEPTEEERHKRLEAFKDLFKNENLHSR